MTSAGSIIAAALATTIVRLPELGAYVRPDDGWGNSPKHFNLNLRVSHDRIDAGRAKELGWVFTRTPPGVVNVCKFMVEKGCWRVCLRSTIFIARPLNVVRALYCAAESTQPAVTLNRTQPATNCYIQHRHHLRVCVLRPKHIHILW